MKTKFLKKTYFILFFSFSIFSNAQVTALAGDYKIIDIGTNTVASYTRNLILLHEMYNGTLLGMNNAIGTITALRGHTGAYVRLNAVEIKSSSAYNGTIASFVSFDGNSSWALKTCIYNGKKYLALDVPYADAHHNWGFEFSGWTKSTGENMKSIAYLNNGLPLNTDILSNIEDFTPNMTETHLAHNFLIMGNNVGIGTTNPTSKLTVAGNIASREVKVTVDAGADFVFEKDYDLPSLESLEKYVTENKHLPEIASAQEMQKEGINLSEMNIKLLQKIEELTLYMIEQNKKIELQNEKIVILENKIK